MRFYSVEKVISENGTMQLESVPFPPGEVVNVIVLARKKSVDGARVHTLKGSVLKYEQPFEPAADNDWDALA
jgi:hypothetical protein